MKKPTIVVIDDDEELAGELKNIFLEEGFEVITYNSTRFVNSLVDVQPDVFLLDVWFADKQDGLSQLSAIHNFPQLTQVPVFLMSSDPTVINQVKLENLAGYFPKPLDFDEVVENISDSLKRNSENEG